MTRGEKGGKESETDLEDRDGVEDREIERKIEKERKEGEE